MKSYFSVGDGCYNLFQVVHIQGKRGCGACIYSMVIGTYNITVSKGAGWELLPLLLCLYVYIFMVY